MFCRLQGRMGKSLPKVIESWEEELPDPLTFLDYPDEIRSTIYTTNCLERAIKEMRKRTKTQDSFPSPQAAEKTRCLEPRSVTTNGVTGELHFKKAKPKLQEKFTDRYGPKKEEQNQTESKEDIPSASPG